MSIPEDICDILMDRNLACFYIDAATGFHLDIAPGIFPDKIALAIPVEFLYSPEQKPLVPYAVQRIFGQQIESYLDRFFVGSENHIKKK